MNVQKQTLGTNAAPRARKGLLPAITIDYKLDMSSMAQNASAPASYAASRASSNNGKKFWRVHRVSGKIIEAKSLLKHGCYLYFFFELMKCRGST